MTSTFSIDEECCDRIRTALEITDVQKDISSFVQRYGTGTRIPAPVKKTSLESLPERGASESTATSKPVTILTNPDEELKSVDRQLQQLEVYTTPQADETFLQTSPQQYTQTIQPEESFFEPAPMSAQPMSGVTNNTDQSNGPVSTAIKEVEQILNNRGFTATSEDIVPSNISADSNQQTQKYKPMPNPVFANRQNSGNSSTKNKEDNNHTRAHSPHQVDEEDDDEQDKENKEYQNRMPRLPPKDEKWVISSIRRPQQLPVRTLNATMFDGNTSVSRNSGLGVASVLQEQQPSAAATEKELNNSEPPYHPKVHRPSVPLTIDIPNSVKPTTAEPPRAIAQQVIDEGRRLSQMSPVQQKIDLNNTISFNQQQSVDHGGIRPAPWQEEAAPDDRMVPNNGSFRGTPVMNGQGYYGNGHASFQPVQEEESKKKFTKNNGKQYSESSIKSKEKESKSARFSLGFFTGNKKEKKKEKENAAAAAAAAIIASGSMSEQQQYVNRQQQQQQQQQQQHHRFMMQQQQQQHTHSNNQATPPAQTTPQAHAGTPYIGYAKAQWPFEATINGELSFQVDEVVGILRKQTDGWWEAERLGASFAGQRGLVPGNYMVEATHPV
ncbi:hypothetical protein EDC94DRAFT_529603 [Helicostylum pulchrum]|nr:hypothetical protein EDC94DRAFT_529603 [Helicostylum pulchrum]